MGENKYVAIAGAIVVVIALVFFTHKKSKKHVESDPSTEEVTAPPPAPKTIPAQTASGDKAKAVTPPPTPSAQPTESKPPEVSLEAQRQFANKMQEMSRCLGLSAPFTENAMLPDPDSVIDVLRPSIGDKVMQMDDYFQTEIIDKANVRKRIRVDYDYVDNGRANRRLSMYKINEYGMPEIIELRDDQADNPNQAYVDSLIEGHKVTVRERGARVYFSNGEEMVFTVKNGRQLENLSVTRGDKTFNCQNLESENPNCNCP